MEPQRHDFAFTAQLNTFMDVLNSQVITYKQQNEK